MKLVYAIIRNDNEDDVTSALMQEGFTVTRLSTTGGFLRKGSTTLMIALQDEQLEQCIDIIKQQSGNRQEITVNMPYVSGSSLMNYTTMPMNVEIGGATIMVVPLERFEKY
ncbi:cyclic-di-AMP receptor [Oribacterium sp.]|jgi:protein of hypothetical function DUF970|nr:cyclic-di-AMP receptor [uncultured Oribacterium sp.]